MEAKADLHSRGIATGRQLLPSRYRQEEVRRVHPWAALLGAIDVSELRVMFEGFSSPLQHEERMLPISTARFRQGLKQQQSSSEQLSCSSYISPYWHDTVAVCLVTGFRSAHVHGWFHVMEYTEDSDGGLVELVTDTIEGGLQRVKP